MAKNIRWQIPFVSIQGVHYRVDIYDEGTFTPVQLTAGPTPFVTDEDASDDFFCPVRTQSGTLQVCTLKPDGTYITLDELLPANNIARPVRLLNLDNSNSIEWQGFLSCEAYSQDYTGIPQILDLPLISVLEAMDSVQLDQTRSNGLLRTKGVLKNAMDEMMLQSGMNFYTHVNYSATSYQILNKYIDQIVLFEQKKYNNENSTTYIVSGLSVKDSIERVATYMGWVVREQGTKIYFERMGDDIYTFEVAYSEFDSSLAVPTIVNFTTKNLATDVTWRGIDHQRSITAGAKSVEVVAKLNTNKFKLEIPDFPFGDVTTEYTRLIAETDSGSVVPVYVYNILNKDTNAYNNLAYAYYESICRRIDNTDTFSYVGPTTKDTVLQKMILRGYPARNYSYDGDGADHRFAGAFLIRYAIDEEQTSTHSFDEGLYCSLNPGIGDVEGMSPIFKMWTPRQYSFYDGRISINFELFYIGVQRYNSQNAAIITTKLNDPYLDISSENMFFYLKVGNLYWDGAQFTSTFSKFSISMSKGSFKHEIPVDDFMCGVVEFGIYSRVTVSDFNTLLEVLFKKIDIDFNPNEYATLSDRGENHYFRLLSTNFRDEISVSTEIASNLNNQPSPSLIMDNSTTPMTTMDYLVGGQQFSETRRPEVDLLNRLAAYYGAARQRLELEVAHPTAAPLPLLKLHGINDGKVYLPLSESRDWQTNVCKLTCFETPT